MPQISSGKNTDAAMFRAGCLQNELRFKFCNACKRAQFPPAMLCRSCGADSLVWRTSAGLGTVHALTIVHRAPTPAFREACPYILALVDFDEGFRMMLNVRGPSALQSKIGDRVRIIFETHPGFGVLPQCELSDPSE
ncbi:MAG: OB-fold domain-containing protein [Pseudomonadota bacterium]|nr:OB-fold domain-containing protein [Pseudomonadota bacterium]